MKKIDSWVVRESCTLRQALQRLDATGSGVLLLVDNRGCLLRTVTDGDIRRLLLAGVALEDTLARLPPLKSKTVHQGVGTAEALTLMNEHGIDQLPVLDDLGRPVGLLHRRDIDAPILLSTPHLSEYEQGFVQEAFQTNWIAPLGPNVDAFEAELAAHVGISHAAALSSGTAAIHLGLRLLGVGPGDTVFCSSLTFVASVNPVLYLGAKPVFIDSEPDTWNMSPRALERALEDAAVRDRLPRAVVVVNLYGQSADMTPLLALCERYEVPVLEDAAESLGATYKGRYSGTLGRIGIYSFNGNKIITTSGGGMLVSEDGELVEKARFLATQARDPAPYYQHSEYGYNYRMSNVLAGIGRGQLKVLEDRVRARREVFARYVDGLADLEVIQWMPEAEYGRSTRWLTAAVLDPEAGTAEALIKALAEERIEARRVWKPMHLQPLFADAPYFTHGEGYSVSDELFKRGICLPSGSNMSAAQQQRIIRTIRQALVGDKLGKKVDLERH